MTSKLKLLVASSFIPIAIAGATPAFAAGTTAGDDILNTVTVNYQVGGVGQTAETDSDTFKVDRKINLTVAEAATTGTTAVSPGQTGAVTRFTVTNTSNAVLDFNVAAAQPAGGAGIHGGTDNFDITALQVFVDVNGNGTYESGTDTATFIDELAEDATITVFVVGTIPAAQNTGDIANTVLTATAREGGSAGGAVGAAVSQTVGANTAGAVDTVFADVAGLTDGNRDAAHSAGDDYTVTAADITVSKTSRVVSDPFNLTVNPKAIPGAVVEYCIAVTNGGGGADATTVAISDSIPATTTYVAASAFVNGVGGPDGSGVCTAGVTAGAFADPVVTGTIPTVAAGTTRNLVFRVTVN